MSTRPSMCWIEQCTAALVRTIEKRTTIRRTLPQHRGISPPETAITTPRFPTLHGRAWNHTAHGRLQAVVRGGGVSARSWPCRIVFRQHIDLQIADQRERFI